ncbi:phosphoglycerate mutase [Methylophilus rhizosphaerae]|uniref:2,3-bisphosphoglycerate-independent phosphoglycerate mutase n=1 Tax=Methylophilus rhizosphaerae TaxID=492660 RepID=A0A1G9EUS0_9PROT|nr:2,3-bisphosphoglycerate-independent phosphoglycerate mutase [Methylophilus rhizosphaerae]SDK79889.1 phosphoglycerate mutase [Methylophilus rhizosphaerae]
MSIKPVILLILDGFGHSETTEHNAVLQASTPNLDSLKSRYPHSLINASEHYVGLPDGQMGNSEVGHLNIGAGRIIFQDFERINNSISSGEFFRLPPLVNAMQALKASDKALHILGLLSDGGVHSYQPHIHAILTMAKQQGLSKVYVHAFLDGRDTPPKSAQPYLEALENHLQTLGVGKVASIGGRFYGMDRDKRWERVSVAYELLVDGIADHVAPDSLTALQQAYARGESDEFVQCTAIRSADAAPVRMEDDDVLVFMNFRSDRARQLTDALLNPQFSGFERSRMPRFKHYLTLTQYDKNQGLAEPVFAPYTVPNTFGEYIAGLGLRQLRIAETEKYPHVTFFFNGGEETVFEGEDRILVPSPKVATYDLQPEMSAPEVTDKLVAAIESGQYQAIICNYANGDMVGHSGNLQAAIKAVETLDTCIGRVVAAAQKTGAEIIITADHGNAESMFDHGSAQVHTQHTTNLVPFIYIGRAGKITAGGALSDIAPTLLSLMGLPKPVEMTGHSLVTLDAVN